MGDLTLGNLADLIAWLDKLNIQDLRYELKKLQALREWAFDQAGIDYAEGDKVRISSDYVVAYRLKDGFPNGRWHYRECLAGGASGTAVRIDFSPYAKAWCTDFRPDREWETSMRATGPFAAGTALSRIRPKGMTRRRSLTRSTTQTAASTSS